MTTPDLFYDKLTPEQQRSLVPPATPPETEWPDIIGSGGKSSGEKLKEEGMAKALDKAGERWRANFEGTAKLILECNGSVTAEEVMEHVALPDGASSNCIGGAMSAFARKNKLVPSYERSTRRSRHGGVVGRWRRE